MTFLSILVISYLSMLAIGVSALWRYRRASPMFWHQAAMALMAIGTFSFIDSELESDRVYLVLLFVAHAMFLSGALVAAGATRLHRDYLQFSSRPETSPLPATINLCVIVLLISATITIIYYVLIGYNVVILMLEGSLAFGDYSDLRLASYSGEEYFAPGYVNQFKNVLLPLTALIVGLYLFDTGRRGALRVYLVVALPLLMIALAGTGQRAFIIYTLGSYSFGYFLHATGRKQTVRWRYLVTGALTLLPLFLGMTAVYLDASDPWDMVSTAISRFTSVQQEGGLFGFQFIYRMPITWFEDWFQGFVGILPGVEGSRIAHEIHAAMYGSDRGTVPLTTIGSAYFNGGVLAVMLLYLIMGIGYTLLYRKYLLGPRSYPRSVAYGFMFFYLSIYVADAPIILLDNGVLTVAVFLYMLRVSERSNKSVPKLELV